MLITSLVSTVTAYLYIDVIRRAVIPYATEPNIGAELMALLLGLSAYILTRKRQLYW